MEPNMVYPAHNHPGYNDLTVGIRCEYRMRTFDIIGTAPNVKSKENFLVKETQSNVLRPDSITSLMSTNAISSINSRREMMSLSAPISSRRSGPDQGFSFVKMAG